MRQPPRVTIKRLLELAQRRARRPWSRVVPLLLTDRSVVQALGASDVHSAWARLASQPFFIRSAERERVAGSFLSEYPDAAAEVRGAADAVLRHEFDLLGSGPRSLGARMPWHTDFKTGREWPLLYSADIEYNELDRPSDVKVPWELSRCQHFTRLGQAYWATGDDRYASEFVAETSDWLSSNPYAHGVNWACAMDVALRAVSWIWGFHFFADAAPCRDERFRFRFLRGLFLHGEFIASHLEKSDVNGNHYLCDGVGLVFLGCFFRGAARAESWRRVGRTIVEQEIFNQTTPDGVDFEQATAYHRLVLEAFLTSYQLLRLHGEEVPASCRERLERMCEFVQAYTKPDGRTPLIGDADDGRVQVLGSQHVTDHRYLLSSAALLFGRGDFKQSATRCWEETFWLLGADAPGRFRALPESGHVPRSVAFPAGGFYILRSPHAHVIVDCGDVGLSGRGGHGHNDILSFELFLNGFNVVTDCGAYLYTASREWRNRFRSTAFHNSVEADGEEMNRFIGPDALWQLHNDARPTGAELRCGDPADVFRGGHTGYERLAPPVSHVREIALDIRCPRLLIRDRLDGVGVRTLTWRFHLDPAVTPEIDGADVRLSHARGELWLLPDEAAGAALTLSLEPGWVSPSYGVKVPTMTVTWSGRTSIPIVAAFLFSAARLTRAERTEVANDLLKAG